MGYMMLVKFSFLQKMRRIQLEGTNVALFDKDVTEADLEFFLKHKKTFKCMWADQVREVETFTAVFIKALGINVSINLDPSRKTMATDPVATCAYNSR